jgi:hypothetical protein
MHSPLYGHRTALAMGGVVVQVVLVCDVGQACQLLMSCTHDVFAHNLFIQSAASPGAAAQLCTPVTCVAGIESIHFVNVAD